MLFRSFINTYRKKKREPVTDLGADFQDDWQLASDPLMPSARSAEVEALERLADSDILQALRELPEEFRVAIYLADVEGYPYREVAEMMGTPIGTVMSRLHRGRAKLRAKLESLVHLRLKPHLRWSRMERRKRYEAALARCEYIVAQAQFKRRVKDDDVHFEVPAGLRTSRSRARRASPNEASR